MFALSILVLSPRRSLQLVMFSFLLQLGSVGVAAAALINPPMPAPTAPAVLPRQDTGIVVVGYQDIGTESDQPICEYASSTY